MKFIPARFSLNALIAIYLIQTIAVCYFFLFQYTDSDQTIQWLALTQYSQGIFHEPYYFGQNYNLMMEAILGIPIYTMGLPLQWSLVLATKLLWIVPVLLLSKALYKRQYPVTAIVLIALNIAMPLEWHVLTGIPRGFIQGISVALLGVVMGLKYLDKHKTHHLFFSVFFLSLGLLLNPNTLLFLVPVGFWVALHLKFNKNEWLTMLLAPLLPLLCYGLAWNFYHTHPEFVMHTSWNLKLSLTHLLDHVQLLVYLFKGLFPWLYEAGLASMVLVTFLFVKAWQISNKKMRWMLGGMLLTLSATLLVNKVSDGSGSTFFPYVRMYIGVFFWYLVPLPILESMWSDTFKTRFIQITSWVALASFIFFMIIFDARKNRIIKTGKGTVDVMAVQQVENDCYGLAQLMKSHQKDLVVILGKSDAHTYGCAALSGDLPTFHPDYERRTWVYHQYIHHPATRCLFVDRDGQILTAIQKYGIQATRVSSQPYPVWVIEAPQTDLESLYTQCHWRILGKR